MLAAENDYFMFTVGHTVAIRDYLSVKNKVIVLGLAGAFGLVLFLVFVFVMSRENVLRLEEIKNELQPNMMKVVEIKGLIEKISTDVNNGIMTEMEDLFTDAADKQTLI